MTMHSCDIADGLATNPNVLILLECPTPQRNPVMDSLPNEQVRPVVVYMEPGGQKQGWGSPTLNHTHTYASASPARTLVHLALFLARCAPDTVVVTFGVRRPPRIMALIVARLRRLQVVTRSDTNLVSVNAEKRLRRIVRKLCWRLLLPKTTRIWSVSDVNEQFWTHEMGLNNVTRIPYSMPLLPSGNGVRPARRTSDPAALRFLYVGRLSPEKRVDLLLEAFMGLASPEHQAWTLTVIGDGPLRSSLETMASADARVSFLGQIEHPLLDRYFAAGDVLVLPSDRDAWGLVVSEALGFGLWVVVSDAVGSSEAVTSVQLGSVFRAGDSSHLAACLDSAKTHLERRPIPMYNPTSDMRLDLEALMRATRGEKQL